MKEKLALVVHRYGLEINGGAEYHCRVIAQHMRDRYCVDVLTSKSKGIKPWDNGYDKDRETIEGIEVLRFAVEDASKFPIDSIESIGPYCPELIVYLKGHHEEYKAVIFFTLHYYTTCVGLRLNLNNAIILPTAHDDHGIWTERYRDIFSYARGILYNTLEEKQLIESIFKTSQIPSRINCFGIDTDTYKKIEDKSLENSQYILYAGRVSNSKNFKELNKYFIEYKENHPSDLKLVVIGKVDNGMEMIEHKDILLKGFVSDKEKNQYIKNALITVLPSRYESLSIIVLESLICGVPVLVNGWCAVLKGQCIRSNAGLYYTNYREFEKELTLLLENNALRKVMGECGKKFVQSIYSWENIIQIIESLINEVSGNRVVMNNQ